MKIPRSRTVNTLLLVTSAASLHAGTLPAPEFVDITNLTSAEVLVDQKLFVPAGPGPFPAVVVMHGCGGLWLNDDEAGGIMVNNFEQWGVLFQQEGYVALFIDSYSVRGFDTFCSKRPAADPNTDDTLCSNKTVRPSDAYSALAYLRTRADVIDDRVGLLGFSHGAESALVTVVDPSVVSGRGSWTISYLNLDNSTTTIPYAAPVTVPAAQGFRAVVAYYPGCGFYSYFGSPSATAANLYMPYAPTLIMHGDLDDLYTPSLYPIALKNKSQSHATLTGHPVIEYPWLDGFGDNLTGTNPVWHELFAGADHSFDQIGPASIRDEARLKAMQWLNFYVRDAVTETKVPEWELLAE